MRRRDRERRQRGRGHAARRAAHLAALEAAGHRLSAPAQHLVAAAEVPGGRSRSRAWIPAPALTSWVNLEEEKRMMQHMRAPALAASRRSEQEREMLRDHAAARNNERLVRENLDLASRAASRLAGEVTARRSPTGMAVRVPDPPRLSPACWRVVRDTDIALRETLSPTTWPRRPKYYVIVRIVWALQKPRSESEIDDCIRDHYHQALKRLYVMRVRDEVDAEIREAAEVIRQRVGIRRAVEAGEGRLVARGQLFMPCRSGWRLQDE